MGPLSLLLLVAACVSLTAGDSCTRQVDPPPAKTNRPDFCVRQASIAAAASFRVFSNGSCLLLGVCPPVAVAAVPLYMRLRPSARLILLRTRPDTQPHAIDLLITGTPDAKQQNAADLRGRTAPYLSPLVTLQPPVFSHLLVQLFDNASSPAAVDLGFRVESSDSLRRALWFAKSRLEAAFPWNVTAMRKENYQLFTANNNRRKFLIHKNHNECSVVRVNMYLFKQSNRDSCDFDSKFTHREYYVFVPNGPDNVADEAKRREAVEFRIIGVVGSSPNPVYVRVK